MAVKDKPGNLVIGIYFHPEAYPPTLNAIGELAELFTSVAVVHRPHAETEWKFPANVRMVPSGERISSKEQELAPLKRKIAFFFQFVRSLLQTCKEDKPATILIYDSISLFAYRFIRPFLRFKHVLWYHNHDVTEWKALRKYSIGWLAGRTEPGTFKLLDIFSLPSNERKQYFPMDRLKGEYFFIPNYPARKFYNPFYHRKKLESPIRLIFQGAIGPFHGIEEIMPFLNEHVEGYPLQLILKGPCSAEYQTKYQELALQHGVSDRLFFAGVTSYNKVPETAAGCHIGIGILAKKDLMNTTLGTASNKLYEYAAVGLPVIYYNSPNFVPFLKQYDWAVAANLDGDSIKTAIRHIIGNYEALSNQAHQDFENSLNFEVGFAPVKAHVKALTGDQHRI